MIERRNLLKGAAAALTTSLFTGRVKGANDRVASGHIGIGAMGSSNLVFALKLPDVEPSWPKRSSETMSCTVLRDREHAPEVL